MKCFLPIDEGTYRSYSVPIDSYKPPLSGEAGDRQADGGRGPRASRGQVCSPLPYFSFQSVFDYFTSLEIFIYNLLKLCTLLMFFFSVPL